MLARHRGLLTRSGILVLALLLAAGPGWSSSAAQETHSVEAGEQPDAASGGARTFDLFDAEELIAACTAMATESAENRAADKERRRKTAYVKCLREAILDQYSGVIASHLSFAERDGADMGEKRSYWEGRAEWIADQTRSCIPSCRPIEQVRSMLDHAVKVGEAVLRDLVAEHNVYAGGERDFSQSADAEALSKMCWNISDRTRRPRDVAARLEFAEEALDAPLGKLLSCHASRISLLGRRAHRLAGRGKCGCVWRGCRAVVTPVGQRQISLDVAARRGRGR